MGRPCIITSRVITWASDWPRALKMAKDGKSAAEIAAALRRSPKQVNWKFRIMGVAIVRTKPVGRRSADIHRITAAQPVPPSLAADRDARYEAALRRTVTQEFFNDPPPGFSALDRKRQQ